MAQYDAVDSIVAVAGRSRLQRIAVPIAGGLDDPDQLLPQRGRNVGVFGWQHFFQGVNGDDFCQLRAAAVDQVAGEAADQFPAAFVVGVFAFHAPEDGPAAGAVGYRRRGEHHAVDFVDEGRIDLPAGDVTGDDHRIKFVAPFKGEPKRKADDLQLALHRGWAI